jgi:hypothetical protein
MIGYPPRLFNSLHSWMTQTPVANMDERPIMGGLWEVISEDTVEEQPEIETRDVPRIRSQRKARSPRALRERLAARNAKANAQNSPSNKEETISPSKAPQRCRFCGRERQRSEIVRHEVRCGRRSMLAAAQRGQDPE